MFMFYRLSKFSVNFKAFLKTSIFKKKVLNFVTQTKILRKIIEILFDKTRFTKVILFKMSELSKTQLILEYFGKIKTILCFIAVI